MTLRIRHGVLVLVLALAPVASHAQTETALNGRWSGLITQSQPRLSYPVQLNVDNGRIAVDYPSLRCGGQWEPAGASRDGATLRFTEKLTHGLGACQNQGQVLITISRDGQAFEYEWTYRGTTARGRLSRVGQASAAPRVLSVPQGRTPVSVRDAEQAKECIRVVGSVATMRLQLPVVQRNRLVYSASQLSRQECKASNVRPFVLENEYPVIGGNAVAMSVAGDICAQVPTFVIYDAVNLAGDLALIYGRNQEPMRLRIAAALAVSRERCGRQPDEMRFVARRVARPDDAAVLRARAGKMKGKETVPFVYTDFYSGRVARSNLRLVGDDPAQEAAYFKEVEQRANAAYNAAEDRMHFQAIGAAVGLFLGAAANQACDPTGPGCP